MYNEFLTPYGTRPSRHLRFKGRLYVVRHLRCIAAGLLILDGRDGHIVGQLFGTGRFLVAIGGFFGVLVLFGFSLAEGRRG